MGTLGTCPSCALRAFAARSATSSSSTRSAPRWRAASGSGWSAPTAPARRRCSRSSPGARRPTADGSTWPRACASGCCRRRPTSTERFITAPTVRAVVRSGAVEVERMERELAEMEARGAETVQSAAYAALRDRFEAVDGYHLDQRVQESLAGLGIPRSHWDHKPVRAVRRRADTRGAGAAADRRPRPAHARRAHQPPRHRGPGVAGGGARAARWRRCWWPPTTAPSSTTWCERVWELRDRRLTMFKGAYSAYLMQREAADARARSHGRLDRRGHRPRDGAGAALPQPAQAREDARARTAAGGAPGEPVGDTQRPLPG